MPCGRKKPVYPTKATAKKHGAITYGSGNYQVQKRKGGWSAYER